MTRRNKNYNQIINNVTCTVLNCKTQIEIHTVVHDIRELRHAAKVICLTYSTKVICKKVNRVLVAGNSCCKRAAMKHKLHKFNIYKYVNVHNDIIFSRVHRSQSDCWRSSQQNISSSVRNRIKSSKEQVLL